MNRQEHLDWLIKMAKTEGWKEYSWARAKEMDKEEQFNGIAKELRDCMLRLKDAPKQNGG